MWNLGLVKAAELTNTAWCMTNISDTGAVEPAVRIAQGDISPVEAVSAAIEACERLNPVLNVLCSQRFERVLDDARTIKPGSVPFAGVPTLIKDLGAPEAGEMACGNCPWACENEDFGDTRNPWNLAHASDGGGSTRVPASANGLVGLKPSRGRISWWPMIGESWAGAAVQGLLSKTVRDTALGLDLVSGPMPGDHYSLPRPVRRFSDEMGQAPGRLRIIAVGMVATVRAIKRIAGRPLTESDMEPGSWVSYQVGLPLTGVEFAEAQAHMNILTRRYAAWWEGDNGYDLLLSPTMAAPPAT